MSIEIRLLIYSAFVCLVMWLPYVLVMIRPGGMVLIDNVLGQGRVIDTTNAIRALNTKLNGNARIILSMIPIGDGITLARKYSQN